MCTFVCAHICAMWISPVGGLRHSVYSVSGLWILVSSVAGAWTY